MLIHFPIALVIAAVAAESAATAIGDDRWRIVAVANVRAGAVFALIAAAAGWRLALAPGAETTPVLEWHRWVGSIAAAATIAAAIATLGTRGRSSITLWMYRVALFGAGALVAVAGHLGGMLVWGADFLRP
jgi:uncharacterized membrane protein